MVTIEDLTPRQREVVLLAVQGLKTAAIADRLFLSEQGVKNHMYAVYKRLQDAGVIGSDDENRVRTVLWALDQLRSDRYGACLTVELPIPSTEISGNNRPGHWSSTHNVRQGAMQEAGWLIRDAMNRAGLYGDVRWERCELTIHWHDHNPVDPDNAVARLKAYVDAAVAVGLLVDDSPKHLDVRIGEIAVDRSRRRVVLEFREVVQAERMTR